MLKLQTTALASVAVAGLVFAAGQANAQSQQLTLQPVSITVQNNFSLVRTTALNFGTYVVNNDSVNTATLTMSPATGTVTPSNNVPARFVSVSATGRSRGVYDVTGAAPSTGLNVTIGNLVNLTCSNCGSSPAITLTSVTPDSATPVTDVNGAATINLGAVLTTVADTNAYQNANYAGSFSITVAY